MEYLIIGAANSGIAAYNLLKSENNRVFLYDDFLGEKLNLLPLLSKDEAKKIIQKGNDNNLNLVVSPGVSNEHWAIKMAKPKGLAILSELDIALKRYLGRIIAVTGTNGKSTVCAMIKHIADQAKIDSSLCGNFGVPLCDLILKQSAMSTLVLELSSYQLEQSAKIYPSLAIFTSFAPDHLDRHKSIENYFQAKWQLFAGLNDTPFIFSESAYKAYKEFVKKPTNEQNFHVLTAKKIDSFAQKYPLLPKSRIFNGTVSAMAMHLAFDLDLDFCFNALLSYKELPHRLQSVGEKHGFIFIDDSKATNVEATLHALGQMHEPVYLLLGGLGKGESFLPLLNHKKHIAKVFAYGDAREQIAKELVSVFDVVCQERFEDIVYAIFKDFNLNHKTVLMSPACASLDQFKNYAERGDFFATMVASFTKNNLK